MDIAVLFIQFISFLCELIKSGAKTLVSQLQKIEQLLLSLHESVFQIASTTIETQTRLNSLEKKMQELHDVVSRSFEELNKQLNKTNCHQELKQKENMDEMAKKVMSVDSRMQESRDVVNRAFEELNKVLKKPNCHQEFKKKENTEEMAKNVMSMDSRMQEFQHSVCMASEQLNQQSNKAICHQPPMERSKKSESSKQILMQEKINYGIVKENVQMLNRVTSMGDLLDDLFFGSEKEQKTFESLCCKWIINDFNKIEKSKFYSTTNFSICGFDLKAQLRLRYNPDETVDFGLSFENKESYGLKMMVKHPLIVTVIFKDRSGRTDKRHIIRYEWNFMTYMNPFHTPDNWLQVKKEELDDLISPLDKSMEVLLLVNPLNVCNTLHSFNGAVNDSIPYFEEKLRMEHMMSHGHWSPFLTYPCGFRGFVRICLNSISDDHQELIASVHFLPLEDFPHEIGHNVTITLIHPDDKSKNIITSKRVEAAGEHKMNIGSVHQIRNGGFITDNLLSYVVAVKVMGRDLLDFNEQLGSKSISLDQLFHSRPYYSSQSFLRPPNFHHDIYRDPRY